MDKDRARQMLADMQSMGKNPPNRQWAYDILRRWDEGDRKHISPAALQIAKEAYKIDQEGLVQEMRDE